MTRVEFVRGLILAEPPLAYKAAGAAVTVAVPTGLRWILGAPLSFMPFATYFPAALLGALFLGWRWALAATVVSALMVDRLVLPQHLFADPTPLRFGIFAVFVGCCALLIVTGDGMRRMVREISEVSREREALGAELYHRMQNLLTVFEALVRFSRAEDVTAFRRDLTERLQALSRANQVLRQGAADGCDLRQLVGQAIEPFQSEGKFELRGGDCTIRSDRAHQLLMMLHELSTNALKHGALSIPSGVVEIDWTALGQGGGCLEWRERGGPPVRAPRRKGLGTRLLNGQRSIQAETDYHPDGLRCVITLLDEAA